MFTPHRLELTGVGKRFGGTTVLSDVSFHVEPGHILGLVGQNGAGKSTLVKILAGLYPDYLGRIEVDGRVVRLSSPNQARSAGVAVIYQEFSLVEEMTVAENILLGREPGGWIYNGSQVRKRAEGILAGIGIDIGVPLSTSVAGLSPAIKQRIEIAKALAENAQVLLMDEPTARLSNTETKWLFRTMRGLADRGVGVVFISHFLEEVLEVTDWVTVLRNGRVVASLASSELDLGAMTRAMLGEELRTQQLVKNPTGGEDESRGGIVLEAVGLSAGRRLSNIDLQLRAGEIVGVAGLVGSGRSRLCRVLAGVDIPTEGELKVYGRRTRFTNPYRALKARVALIPEDRKNQALSLSASIKDNIVLMAIGTTVAPGGIVPVRLVKQLANKLVKQLEVSPNDIESPVGNLSGGNQQKVVVGKAIATNPRILIVDQPTAGVDVGTKAQLHHVLRELANSGAALLVVSDDLDELFTLSDRICIMRAGTISWEGPASAMDREILLTEISLTSSAS